MEDPRWSTLSHAYGPATNVPDLLRQLASATASNQDYDAEPWFTLWSSLCHQGDIFDASYAALPHLVAISIAASGSIDHSFFQLPAAIEIARKNGNGPEIPSFLEDSYSAGISQLLEAIAIHRHDGWDQGTLISALAALAVSKGQARIAEAILNLDDELITKLIELDF